MATSTINMSVTTDIGNFTPVSPRLPIVSMDRHEYIRVGTLIYINATVTFGSVPSGIESWAAVYFDFSSFPIPSGYKASPYSSVMGAFNCSKGDGVDMGGVISSGSANNNAWFFKKETDRVNVSDFAGTTMTFHALYSIEKL